MRPSPLWHRLHLPSDESRPEEVILLADAVGDSATKLAEVMRDFVEIIPDPVIAGGFAMAFHGFVRATVDIDVLSVGSTKSIVNQFRKRNYKYESMILPIGRLEMLSKGNKGIDIIHLTNASFAKSIQKRAKEGTFFQRPVRFVSLEDLILLKLLAIKGRNKKFDAADLDALMSKKHDAKYVKNWRKKLGLISTP